MNKRTHTHAHTDTHTLITSRSSVFISASVLLTLLSERKAIITVKFVNYRFNLNTSLRVSYHLQMFSINTLKGCVI